MEKIRILVIEPNQAPKVEEIEPKLEEYQRIVGGYIEAVYPWGDDEKYGNVALICNEEGKYNGCVPNRSLGDYDIIFGTFIIAGLGEEDFCGLTQELIDHYEDMFRSPEIFFRTPDGIVSVKTDLMR